VIAIARPGERRGLVHPAAAGMVALLAALLLCLVGTPASAQTFPPFAGLVTDAANVLPADRKAALEAKLQALQQQTGRQLVVATIPDLQGYDIADYGYRLGRAWGVGLKGADNGIVLFIAPNEPAGRRGPRIEVGRRLEPVVTDALSSMIIRTRMIPLLREDRVADALDAGADALITQLKLPDAQAQAEVSKAAIEYDRTHKRSTGRAGGIPLGMVFWVLVVAFVLLANLRARSRQGVRYRGGVPRSGGGQGNSDWPIWLWAASEIASQASRSRGDSGSGSFGGWGGSSDSGSSDGSWMGGGFTGGGGGDFGGGGASGDW